jgi:1-acyl-sn-glycerol-3-phosphate acyltransferase
VTELPFYSLLRHIVHAFCLVYFRIEFHGAERVPSTGPVIFTPNHASYVDPVWVSIPIRRRLRYMTWDRMFQVPVLGPVLRVFGAFPVNVEAGDPGALRQSLEHLRAGGALMIFPEGTRTRSGQLMPFKQGAIRLALKTGAPIVPVTIIGGYRAYSRWHRFPRPYKVKVFYHEPIRLSQPADEMELKRYMREQAARLQRIVASGLPEAATAGEAAQGEAG